MNRKIRESGGITLIALIVTIIVLLILSGISISMLTGQNGILGKASEAKLYSERTSLLEALQLKISEYMIDGVRTNEEAIKKLKEEGYINEDNTININKTAIQSMSTGKGSIDTGDVYVLEQRQKVAATNNENVALNYYLVYYDKENNDIEIGKVFGFVNGENKVDLAEILEDFTKNPDKYTAEGQSPTNGDRAIGTDGKAVNMDLWSYTANDEKKEISLGSVVCAYVNPSYSNNDIKDGKIQGSVPQYIKIDGKEGVYTVTDLTGAFYGCKDLIIAPEIPSSVTNMSSAFSGCAKLVTAPKIPGSVTSMEQTFSGCTSLTGTVTIISKNVNYAWECFGNTVNDIIVQVPSDSTTYTEFNKSSGSLSNITIQQY